MLSRHAAGVAVERAALASSARALLALLPGRGEHVRRCPGCGGGICVAACSGARGALTEARAILFPWTRRRSSP